MWLLKLKMGNSPCFCLDINSNKNGKQGEIIIGKGVFKFKKVVFIFYII